MKANYKVSETARFAECKSIIITNWHAINEIGIIPYHSIEVFEKNLKSVVPSVVAVFKIKNLKNK